MPICHLNIAKIPYTMHFNELQLGWPSLHYKQTYIIYIYKYDNNYIYPGLLRQLFLHALAKGCLLNSSEGLFIYDIS